MIKKLNLKYEDSYELWLSLEDAESVFKALSDSGNLPTAVYCVYPSGDADWTRTVGNNYIYHEQADEYLHFMQEFICKNEGLDKHDEYHIVLEMK